MSLEQKSVQPTPSVLMQTGTMKTWMTRRKKRKMSKEIRKIYDTCSLLKLLDKVFEEHFYIASPTLAELEHIKTSANKDPEVKFKARRMTKLLRKNYKDYDVVNFTNEDCDYMARFPQLIDNEDSKIVICAYKLLEQFSNVMFVTEDNACWNLARSIGIPVDEAEEAQSINEYTGYQVIEFASDDELAIIYENIFDENQPVDMNLNEYLLLYNTKQQQVIDQFKWTSEGFKKVPFYNFKSKHLGMIKPKNGDAYQTCVMDSLVNNQVTIATGPAGSGKTLLGLGYFFQELERGNIDKISAICNVAPVAGATQLGFYPGSRSEKLLDSSIGSILSTKLGDREAVLELIDEGRLELVPLADLRGSSFANNSGVFITEGQNLNREHMKLILQRIEENTKVYIEGDNRQVDDKSFAGENNGMRRAIDVLKGEDLFGTVALKNIHRSRLANIAERI